MLCGYLDIIIKKYRLLSSPDYLVINGNIERISTYTLTTRHTRLSAPEGCAPYPNDMRSLPCPQPKRADGDGPTAIIKKLTDTNYARSVIQWES